MTVPCWDMWRALSSPWPGSGLNITTGSRTENASRQVTPPAFWISTSEAAIRSGIC